MNKVCLVLSLGLLTMSTQQFCNRNASPLEQAQSAHEVAKREYNNAVNELIRLKKLSWIEKGTLDKAEEDQRLKFNKYQKTEKDLADAKKLQAQNDARLVQQLQQQTQECIDDSAIARQLAKPESAHAFQMQVSHDAAPPSYAEATAPDELAREVAIFTASYAAIKRLDPEKAQELIQREYRSNCWWCR